MADITELNPELSNVTLVNQQILELNNRGAVTEINPMVLQLNKFNVGELLNGKYKIISRLETESGEADLYLCENNNESYIAKVYKRDRSRKLKVTEVLKTIHSPYIASIIDDFEIEGMQVEILPYYKRGSLVNTTLNEKQLKDTIIPDLNEGLRILHENDIVHKDIKPSNIMWADNGEDVVIIDFGISSLLDGNDIVKTRTGLTLKYAAPESLSNVVSPLSDYYSLGITIFELLEGRTPYGNMSAEELRQYYSIQNVPIPDDISDDFKDLIKALTYFDIKNADDPNNPNCRWGYEKVKEWCNGIKQVVPGTGFGGLGNMPQYRFLGMTYSTRESLAKALCDQWEKGKAELYRGKLKSFFESFDKKTSDKLGKLESSYAINNDREDLYFREALYEINEGTRVFYWNDYYWDSPKDVGNFILETFRNNSFNNKRKFEDMIQQSLFSNYIHLTLKEHKEVFNSIAEIEKKYINSKSKREKSYYAYLLGYQFSDETVLVIDNQKYNSIQELINNIIHIKSQSIDQFEKLCRNLISVDNELDPQLEAWLVANKKFEIVQKWKKEFNK